MPTNTARGLVVPNLTGDGADLHQMLLDLANSIEAMMNSPLVLGSSLTVPGDVISTGGAFESRAAGFQFSLADLSAGADLKRARLSSAAGVTTLRSLTDALANLKTGLTMDHATGVVDHPNGATVPTASPGDNDTSAASTAFVQAAIAAAVAAAAVVPPGTLIPSAATATPTGYLPCDGASYLQATYPALFAAIGTAYGSVDGTHFNVPDSRGRALYAKGTHVDVDTLGKNDGFAVGSRRVGHVHGLGSHTHTYSGNTAVSPANVSTDANLDATFISVPTPGHTHAYSGTSSGPSGASDLAYGSFLVVNHFIKT